MKEMGHYKDLRETYAKRMEYHGNGVGLFQPIAAEDMQPPCCGFFDRNGDWNLIANLSAERKLGDIYEPLEYQPTKVTDIQIEWQPKTSLGVNSISVDTSINTPDSLPGGGDAHIQYASNNKFGAVLMTTKPVTLHAYNQEGLFLSWLSANRERLFVQHSASLKQYGLWIVTRTWTSPGASINAWLDTKKTAIVSLKAKAAMLGELGEDLNWSDKLTDRDWCHYKCHPNGNGLVIFMDGIEVKPYEWWVESFRHNLIGRRRSAEAALSTPLPPVAENDSLAVPAPRQRSASSQRNRVSTLVADDDVLQDAGLMHFGRSPSLRKASYSSSVRSPSLRRETRSIYNEKEGG